MTENLKKIREALVDSAAKSLTIMGDDRSKALVLRGMLTNTIALLDSLPTFEEPSEELKAARARTGAWIYWVEKEKPSNSESYLERAFMAKDLKLLLASPKTFEEELKARWPSVAAAETKYWEIFNGDGFNGEEDAWLACFDWISERLIGKEGGK